MVLLKFKFKVKQPLVFRDHVTRTNSIEYHLDTPNAKTKEVKPPLSDLCCVIPMWRHQVAQTGKVERHSPLHDLSGYPLLWWDLYCIFCTEFYTAVLGTGDVDFESTVNGVDRKNPMHTFLYSTNIKILKIIKEYLSFYCRYTHKTRTFSSSK